MQGQVLHVNYFAPLPLTPWIGRFFHPEDPTRIVGRARINYQCPTVECLYPWGVTLSCKRVITYKVGGLSEYVERHAIILVFKRMYLYMTELL